MSKAAKQSLFILVILLIGSVGFAGYTLLQKQELEKSKAMVEKELASSQDREKKSLLKVKELEDNLAKASDEKDRIEKKVKKAEQMVQELQAQVSDLNQARDTMQRRVETVQKERDELVAKLQQKTREEETMVQSRSALPVIAPEQPAQVEKVATSTKLPAPAGDEEYWASVLRDKASLEIEINRLKQDLAKDAVDIVNLKQKNANLQIELDGLRQEKESIERTISSKEALINSFSLELARAKNDKKMINDQVDKMAAENNNLRDQLKQLNATKSALEKSYVRLQEDKTKIEHKLIETESLIQTKIDEIWGMKSSIDSTVSRVQKKVSVPTHDVELDPIIVKPQGPVQDMPVNPGYSGKVVSMNQENNFVIVDLGDKDGVKLGETLSVYQGPQYIARLEIIQVRGDISAADIKEQWAKIKVGDSVR